MSDRALLVLDELKQWINTNVTIKTHHAVGRFDENYDTKYIFYDELQEKLDEICTRMFTLEGNSWKCSQCGHEFISNEITIKEEKKDISQPICPFCQLEFVCQKDGQSFSTPCIDLKCEKKDGN